MKWSDKLDYKIRGYISSKSKDLRSLAYKYMSIDEIILYERNLYFSMREEGSSGGEVLPDD
ncbi:hypothetical protein [Kineothrix sedimenti]|uniref:Uncharacterized protein n=1 Tax=Kineothrix sedimenti TaxID=3123317 RepID=A0ABZ3ESD7_9FIRM